MDLHQLILSRRTVFTFEDRPVPESVLMRALEAARWAPNHKHTEPWRFVLTGPETERKLRAYQAEKLLTKLRARGMSEDEIAERAAQVPVVPLQLLVLQVLDGDEHRRLEDYAATCCAIENMMLSAWGDGVASGWKTFEAPAGYALFGLDPEKVRIVGLIQMGYAERERPGHRKHALEELIVRTP